MELHPRKEYSSETEAAFFKEEAECLSSIQENFILERVKTKKVIW
jgi:hypothetical protein